MSEKPWIESKRSQIHTSLTTAELRSQGVTALETWTLIREQYTPIHRKLVVRTDPPPKTTKGGVHLPAMLQDLNYGLGHAQWMKTTVLGVNPITKAKIGDRAFFRRTAFVRLLDLPDGSLIGLVAEGRIDFLVRDQGGDNFEFVSLTEATIPKLRLTR